MQSSTATSDPIFFVIESVMTMPERASSPLYSIPNLTNLCENRNFCDQLRNCRQQVSDGGRYFGTLDDTDCFKHLIYFPGENGAKRSAHSLREIMSWRQGSIVNLSPFERIVIARSLANAVLQYHATPWLRSPLRCTDIYLSDEHQKQSPNNGRPYKIPELHIDVSITEAEPTSILANSFAPNTTLYHLAVVLIELAFEASIDSLLNEAERSGGDRYTEFFAAKRLAGSVSKTIMGFALSDNCSKVPWLSLRGRL